MTSAFEIVCFIKAGGPLTKRIYLNQDGSTKSDGSECLMPRGMAVRTPITDLAELATLISGLRPNQAIANNDGSAIEDFAGLDDNFRTDQGVNTRRHRSKPGRQ